MSLSCLYLNTHHTCINGFNRNTFVLNVKIIYSLADDFTLHASFNACERLTWVRVTRIARVPACGLSGWEGRYSSPSSHNSATDSCTCHARLSPSVSPAGWRTSDCHQLLYWRGMRQHRAGIICQPNKSLWQMSPQSVTIPGWHNVNSDDNLWEQQWYFVILNRFKPKVKTFCCCKTPLQYIAADSKLISRQ